MKTLLTMYSNILVLNAMLLAALAAAPALAQTRFAYGAGGAEVADAKTGLIWRRCVEGTEAKVCVVCAGMEGALPSVIGGLVPCPVIAVPTSIGYGASFHGLAALLGMLNSCASNVTVVNIDNGFGAGYVASLINRV